MQCIYCLILYELCSKKLTFQQKFFYQLSDPTQSNPSKYKKIRPNPTQPNPTHGWTRPMAISAVSDGFTKSSNYAKCMIYASRTAFFIRNRSYLILPSHHIPYLIQYQLAY